MPLFETHISRLSLWTRTVFAYLQSCNSVIQNITYGG